MAADVQVTVAVAVVVADVVEGETQPDIALHRITVMLRIRIASQGSRCCAGRLHQYIAIGACGHCAYEKMSMLNAECRHARGIVS